MLLGRDHELKELNDLYAQHDRGIILLSGPLYVGKTELMTWFLSGKQGEYFYAKSCTDTRQLKLFSKTLVGDEMTFQAWDEALGTLATYPATEKHVLVIDEFQNIQRSDNHFLDALKRTWEHKLQHCQWLILLVTSSEAFLEMEFYGSKRQYDKMLIKHIKLGEIGSFDMAAFFPLLDAEGWVKCYSLLGGNPWLLRRWKVHLDFEEQIRKVLLAKESGFHLWVDGYFNKELRETQV